MKKLLMGSVILCLFSLSIVLNQTSCSKSEAQNSTLDGQLNKIIYTNFDNEIWISDYDGSNAVKVNLALPANVIFESSLPRMSVKMSPDGKKIFFSGTNTATTESGIYSSDISGNNVAIVKIGTGGAQPILGGVY